MTGQQTKGGSSYRDRLEAALALVEPLSGATSQVTMLRQLQARIEQQQALVAVFGAFSAGKSSLLNALMGEPLLAVSPNPTTAAVTRIEVTSGDKLRIRAKDESELWSDVDGALRRLGHSAGSLSAAVAYANQLSGAKLSSSARPAYAFLRSVAAGYEDMAPRLGSDWRTSQEEMKKYTADERYACYLADVTVSVPGGQIPEGFVFVDTPGVDSIHRRHTEVAFSYMREADAILFVLYYTHAFSRADKNFLQQLAGVQDVMGTDKLFVVINAVDLARSETERQAVRERVEEELLQLGIRRPRIYEVSSQIALAARQLASHDAGLSGANAQGDASASSAAFEQLVRQRLHLSAEQPLPPVDQLLEQSGIPALAADLQEFAIHSREQMQEDAVERTLSFVGQSLQAELLRKKTLVSAALADAAALAAAIEDGIAFLKSDASSDSSDLEQEFRVLSEEWTELQFHIGERIRLRFAGLFREAFYPGRFRGNVAPKLALKEAALELVQMLEGQVDMEMRTFALRVAGALPLALQQKMNRTRAALEKELQPLLGDKELVFPSELVDWSHLRAALDTADVEKEFRHFSNAKSFFEGSGQSDMLAASEPGMMQSVRSEIERMSQSVFAAAKAAAVSCWSDVQESWLRELQDLTETDASGGTELSRWEEAIHSYFDDIRPRETGLMSAQRGHSDGAEVQR